MAVEGSKNSKSTFGKATSHQEGFLWLICAIASIATCFLLFKMCVSDSQGSDWYVQLTCTIGAGALGLLCCLCLSPRKDEQAKRSDGYRCSDSLHSPSSIGSSQGSIESCDLRGVEQGALVDPAVADKAWIPLVELSGGVALCKKEPLREAGGTQKYQPGFVEEVVGCGGCDRAEGLAGVHVHPGLGTSSRKYELRKTDVVDADGRAVEVLKKVRVVSVVDGDKGANHIGPGAESVVVQQGSMARTREASRGNKVAETNGLSLGLGLAKFVSSEECVSEILDDTLGSPLSEYGSDEDLDMRDEAEEMAGDGSGSGSEELILLAREKGVARKSRGEVGLACMAPEVAVDVATGAKKSSLSPSEVGEESSRHLVCSSSSTEDVVASTGTGIGKSNTRVVSVEAECVSEPGSLTRSRGSGATSSSSGSGSLTGLGRGARRQFAGFLEEFWSGVFDLHGKPAGPLDVNEWLKQAQVLGGGAPGGAGSAPMGGAVGTSISTTATVLQRTVPANMRTTGLLGGARDDYNSNRLGTVTVDRDSMVLTPLGESGLDHHPASGGGGGGGPVRNWHHHHRNFVASSSSGLEWGSDSPTQQQQRALGLCDAAAELDAKRGVMRSPEGSDEALSPPERLGGGGLFLGGGRANDQRRLQHTANGSGSFEKSEADWVLGPHHHVYAITNQAVASQQLGQGSFLHHEMANVINSASSDGGGGGGPSGIGNSRAASSWEVASSAYDSAKGDAAGFRTHPSSWHDPYVNVNHKHRQSSHVDPQLRMKTRMPNWDEPSGLMIRSGTTRVGRQLSSPPEKLQQVEPQGWGTTELWRSQSSTHQQQQQPFPSHDKDLESAAARFRSASSGAPSSLSATAGASSSAVRLEQPPPQQQNHHLDDLQGSGGRDPPPPPLSYDRFGNVHSHSLWSCQPHEQLFPPPARVVSGGVVLYGRGGSREHGPAAYGIPAGMRPVDFLGGGHLGGGMAHMGGMTAVSSCQMGGRVGLTRRQGGGGGTECGGGGDLRESAAGLQEGRYSTTGQKHAQQHYQVLLEDEGRHGSWPRASSELYRMSSGTSSSTTTSSWQGRDTMFSGGSLRTTQAQSHYSVAAGVAGVYSHKERDVTTTTALSGGRHVSSTAPSSQGQVIFQNGTDVLKALRACITSCLKLEGSEWLFRTGCDPDENLIAAVGACVQVRHLLMGCGNSCAWGPGIMVSFGVWCVRRVLELSRLESRPELWGKYTYVLNHLQGILEPAFLRPRTVAKFCMCLSPRMATLPDKQHSTGGHPRPEKVLHGGENNTTSSSSSMDESGKCNSNNKSSKELDDVVGLKHVDDDDDDDDGGDGHDSERGGATAAKFLEIIKDVEQAVASRKGRTGTAAGDVAFPKGKENLASVLKRYKRRLANKPMGGGVSSGSGSGGSAAAAGGTTRGEATRASGPGGSGSGRSRGGSFSSSNGLVGHSLG